MAAERKTNPYLSSGPTPRDAETDALLAEQGLEWTSVPEAGQTVRMARNDSFSLGGDTVDVTDILPDAVRRATIDALASMPNAHIAGIDVIRDREGSGDFAILEMNSRRHIPLSTSTSQGRGAGAPGALMDYFFPDHQRAGRAGDDRLTLSLDTVQQTLLARRASAFTLLPQLDHGLPARLQWTSP